HQTPWSCLRLKLVQVLMGNGEAHPVLAQFREHVGHGESGKALELVYINKEVSPLLGGDIGSTESCQSDGRDQKSTKQRRAVLSDMALCQVDQKHSPSSMIWRMRTSFSDEVTIRLSLGSVRKAPTLF